MTDEFIERKIVIGLITSTEYIQQIRDIFQIKLIAAPMAKRMATWCIEHYDKYDEAPGPKIEDIYFEKLRKGLPKDIGEEIEEDILPSLSDEFKEDKIDIQYLIDQTKQYFIEQSLEHHSNKIQELLRNGDVEDAVQVATEYKEIATEQDSAILLSDPDTLKNVEKAFEDAQTPLVTYPKHLGQFWNHQLVRGGFVALMGSEKRGKSFWLMDMAIRSVRQGLKVAFFQAGDMTEGQQLRRFCIHLARNSDREKYCGKMLEPVRDCIYNQLDICDKKERECDHGVFPQFTVKELRNKVTIDDLREAYEEYPDYKTCFNCEDYKIKRIGTPWVAEIEIKAPLTAKRAQKVYRDYFIKKKSQLLLSTHANGTLSIPIMKSILAFHERRSGFIPDVIVIDYADLLEIQGFDKDERSKQNKIWKDLRNLSQEERGGNSPLVITVTQADADSYTKELLKQGNFSEDKRKYGHVTAMYGLNQDPEDREKKIGIMRLNELVLREDEFSVKNQIHVLQNLRRGIPFLESYF